MPEVGGIHYHDWTDPDVIALLESFRHDHERGNSVRLRLHYGDRITGEDWMDTVGTTGHIGYLDRPGARPLLIHNERSAGSPIPTECIVRIASARTRYWSHPTYHVNPARAQQTLEAIGERAFIHHFGREEFELARLHATLIHIISPEKATPTERETTTWPTSQA